MRKNYESRLQFSEASDFFIGEMEGRRKQIESYGNKLKATGYHLYKIIARYGESISLPLLVWTPTIIIIFFILRILFGYVPAADIEIQKCETNYYNFTNICNAGLDSLTSYFQFPRSDNTLDMIERIVSAPILGTVFIALKRRFERNK